jgi:hypothetical protein
MLSTVLRRTYLKWQRLRQQCTIAALQEQRSTWLLTFTAQFVDLLALPEIVDLLARWVKFNTRPLSPLEMAEARKVFGNSIPLEYIRIDEFSLLAWMGAWLQNAPQMGVTIFYTINFTRRLKIEAASGDMGWLIHELVHVAQMHHVGSRYIWEALHAQNSAEGYDYGNPRNLLYKNLAAFNREQQGDIVRHYYDYVLYGEAYPLFKQYYQAHYYDEQISDLQKGKL